MKPVIAALFALFFFCEANSQYTRVAIQLTDKGNSTYSLSNPSQFLSARALQRRARFNIALDSTDLPVTPAYVNAIAAVPNVTVLSTSKWLNRVLIMTSDANALTAIQALPFVESVKGIAPRLAQSTLPGKFTEKIEPLSASQNKTQQVLSNTFNYGNNYNQVHIHEGEFLHNKGFTGAGIQVTMLDAGFFQYSTNTAFDSARLNGQILGVRDFVAFDNSVTEDDTHGMYCLSTMVANWPGRMVGTAPKANYWLVRTENAPTEYVVEEYNWVVGAEFADSTGSDMISSSLGYNTFDDASFNHTYSQFYTNTATVTQGATLATKKGMIVMNSAGNEGSNSWKYIVFPADADSVCTVGAVNSQGVYANFSSRGFKGKLKPNIVSVGVSTVIAGTNSSPSAGNGTSFSTPNVAGLVACLWQAFPTLNNMQLLDAVYRSANRYNNPDSAYGYGIPNFKTAYRLIKHDQNVALYGNEWLWASPDPFDTSIYVKLIGRVDGNATVRLKNLAGQTIKTIALTTEMEEVYNLSFDTLSSLPSGYYNVEYADGTTTRAITLRKGNILALRLIDFNGALSNNEAVLNWVVENEMSVRRYELERSAEGVTYATLGTVTPNYNAGQSTYSYRDRAILADGFYRLKMVLADGSISYSNIVELKIKDSQLTLVYDQATGNVVVSSLQSNAQQLLITAFAADGKKVYQRQQQTGAGNTTLNVPVRRFSPGVYVIVAELSGLRKTIRVIR